ncbi:hypothetical protein Tco_0482621 [Tanacetum coccineum]
MFEVGTTTKRAIQNVGVLVCNNTILVSQPSIPGNREEKRDLHNWFGEGFSNCLVVSEGNQDCIAKPIPTVWHQAKTEGKLLLEDEYLDKATNEVPTKVWMPVAARQNVTKPENHKKEIGKKNSW